MASSRLASWHELEQGDTEVGSRGLGSLHQTWFPGLWIVHLPALATVCGIALAAVAALSPVGRARQQPPAIETVIAAVIVPTALGIAESADSRDLTSAPVVPGTHVGSTPVLHLPARKQERSGGER